MSEHDGNPGVGVYELRDIARCPVRSTVLYLAAALVSSLGIATILLARQAPRGWLPLVAVLGLAPVLVAASMAAWERRRETSVLRALGATRSRILRVFALEASILGLSGSLLGALAAASIVSLRQDLIGGGAGAGFGLPSTASLAGMAALEVATVVCGISAAYAVPAAWLGLEGPGHAMGQR